MVTTSVLRFCHMRCDEDVILAWISTAQSGNFVLGVRSWVFEVISIYLPDWTWGRGHPTPPRCPSIITRCWELGFGVSSILSHCVIIILVLLSSVSRQLHIYQWVNSRFNLILKSLLSFELRRTAQVERPFVCAVARISK